MIEHIVLFKFPRIVDEIVIDGIFAHHNAGIGDNLVEVNGFPVARPGIDLFGIHDSSFLRKWIDFNVIKAIVLDYVNRLFLGRVDEGDPGWPTGPPAGRRGGHKERRLA